MKNKHKFRPERKKCGQSIVFDFGKLTRSLAPRSVGPSQHPWHSTSNTGHRFIYTLLVPVQEKMFRKTSIWNYNRGRQTARKQVVFGQLFFTHNYVTFRGD